jgi:hypothetical protein
MGSGRTGVFEPAIASALNSRKVNVAPVDGIIQKFAAVFKPADGAELSVLRHAVYGFYFDRLFAKRPGLLSVGETEMAGLMQGCHHLRWATPNAMIIPAALMKPEMMNQTFIAIVQKSPTLEEAVRLIESVQFLVNPMEIMTAILQAIKAGEEFVRRNRLANRFGECVGMFEKHKVPGAGNWLLMSSFHCFV